MIIGQCKQIPNCLVHYNNPFKGVNFVLFMSPNYHFFKDMSLLEIKSQGYIPKGIPALVDLGFPTVNVSSRMPILVEAVETSNGKYFEYQGIAVFSKSDCDRRDYKPHQRISGREITSKGIHLLIIQ